ncbi:hypothetical protein [Dactylosporangium darangshiense]|uniref:Uncharacterized protein n=1 Tax=Dactylosporangium darangshiense TaxID=579108 RepID=A0ABP8DH78_9ACTN
MAALDREIRDDPDLAAVRVLIAEYTRKVLDQWRAYGIITIPPEVVESFVRNGTANGARWGGEHERSKDIMHLELLRLASPDSQGRAGRSGRRPPVTGLRDLMAPGAVPAPVNGPP